jgi:hypothetical protein
VPPTGLVGGDHQVEHRGAGLVVDDSVEREQVGHVALLESDPAELHTADLGFGAPDEVARLLARDSPAFPQPSKLGAKEDAQRRRPGARLVLRHVASYQGPHTQ